MNLCKNLSFLFLIILFYGFKPGDGAEYQMSSHGKKNSLSIYVTMKKDSLLGVELFFHDKSSAFMPNMWQQFLLKREHSAIEVISGHRKTSKGGKVEIMTKEDMSINKGKGVELTQFLFSKEEEIQKDFVGEEVIEVIAGSVTAKHYRKIRNGQIVDFWISNEVKPIGLVKLKSQSKELASHNYEIELKSILINVTPEIEPLKPNT